MLGQTGKVNPTRKWLKVETEHFEILYTSPWRLKAERVSYNLEHLYKNDTILGNRRLGKTKIILQGNTVQSNGFVGFAPFRSEFFLMPPQNAFLSSGNWLDLLSIHEYHHVLQHHKINKGVVRGFGVLFGEFGQAISANILVPKWFWEGDAVYAETKYSYGGRGRSSDFLKYYRAIALGNDIFNLRRAIGGTINKFTPNHYNLGYLLSKQIRENSHEQVFSPIIDRTTEKLVSFTNSIRRETRNSLEGHFYKSIQNIRNSEKKKSYWKSAPLIKTSKSNFYTDQISLFTFKNDIYYIHKDFKHLPFLRSLKYDSPLAKPGISLDNFHNFGMNDNYICWSEFRKLPRWELEDFSIVKVKDRKTGKLKSLQKNAKHFYPQLHPSQDRLAVLSANQKNEFSLEIWNLETMDKIKSIPIPYEHAREMYYNENGSSITVIVSQDQRQGILDINLDTEQSSLLIPLQYKPLNCPKVFNNHLYFLGTKETDQYLYQLNLENQILSRSNKKFLHSQSYTFNGSEGDLYYNDYSTDGYQIKTIAKENLENSFVQAQDFTATKLPPLFTDEVKQVSTSKVNAYIPKFKLHSYVPSFTANSGGIKHLGATILINDYLSTSQIQLNYQKDYQGNDDRYFVDFSYGYLPIQVGIEARHDLANVTHSNFNGVFSIKEKSISPYIAYPTSQITGNYSHLFTPSLGYSKKSISSGYFNDDLESLFYNHELIISKRKATAQALPNFRYSQHLRYEDGKNGKNDAHIFEISNELTLPGLVSTHSSKVTYAFRNHSTDNYQYSWDFILPYGYFYSHEYIGQAIQKENMHYYGLHYQLPLGYPNVGIGKFAYFKRFRMEGFFQKAIFQSKNETSTHFTSKGVQFYIDANWFQMGNASAIFTISNTPENEKSETFYGIGIEFQVQ